MNEYEQWQTGRSHRLPPIVSPPGTCYLSDLPKSCSLYVQHSPEKDRLRYITLEDGVYCEGDRKYACVQHLMNSYRKRFKVWDTCTNPLEHIFVAEGFGIDESLADLLRSLNSVDLGKVGTGEDEYVELHPPPATHLPHNLAVYCQFPRSSRFDDVLCQEVVNEKSQQILKSIGSKDVQTVVSRDRYIYVGGKWIQVGKIRPYQHVFVAKGKYKDRSLWELFTELSTEQLRTVGFEPVAAVPVVESVAPVAPVAASASKQHPLTCAAATLTAKHEAALQEIKELEGVELQIKKLATLNERLTELRRLDATDIDAKIAAAETELASLELIRAQVEQLRVLTERLVESRKILASPECV
jgi:hypothetical protein